MEAPSGIIPGQLESHLPDAAKMLCGPDDTADLRTHILPLLFFKRISDEHREKYQAAPERWGGDLALQFDFSPVPQRSRSGKNLPIV